VLVWVAAGRRAAVAEALRERAAGWAEVVETAFESAGATVTTR
jgi:hypothetical protein